MKAADDNQVLDKDLREKILRSGESSEEDEFVTTEIGSLSDSDLQAFIRQNWGKKVLKDGKAKV